MTPELWAQVERVFAEVCDVPSAARAAKIAELCGDDSEVRAEVESLLDHDESDFLATSPHLPPGGQSLRAGAAGPTLPLDFTVDDFEIRAVIGRGGQGTVYRARQGSLDREVALKVMTVPVTGDDDRDVGERFRREAHAVAKLSHENIVRVHSYGERDGHRYYSMEYVEGGTAAEWARRGDRGDRGHIARVAALGCDVARAIAYAHDAGVIHRDVKPSNILLAANGTPKLVDFGLAKETAQPSLSITGNLLGTPQYLAPEILRGEPPSPRVDIYGWGATLYHLLTGAAPFEADTLHETLRRVLSSERPALDAAIPRDLRVIVGKCLEKRPEDRYPDAASLVNDLERYRDGRPILARPVGRLARAGRAVVRHPWASAAAVALFLAVAVAVVTLLQARRSDLRAEGLEYLRAASETIEHNPRLSLFLAVEGARRTPGLEANEALYTALALCTGFGSEVRGYVGHRGWVHSVRFDPSGERLVSASRDGTACVYDLGQSQPRFVFEGHAAEVLDARFSDDATRVVTASFDGTVRVWDAATGDSIDCFSMGSPVFAARLIDDQVITAAFDGWVRVFRLGESTEPEIRIAALPALGFEAYRHAYGCQRLAFRSDGRRFAAVDAHGHLGVWTSDGDRVVDVELRDRLFDGRFVAFAPDGNRVAALTTTELHIVDVGSSERRTFSLDSISTATVAIAWAPDGSTLAMSDSDEVVLVETERGEVTHRFPANVSSPHGLVFLEDGAVLANAQRDGVVDLWDLSTRTRLGVLRGHAASIGWIAASPDVRHLIVVGDDPRFRLFSVDRFASDWVVATLAENEGKRSQARWTGDDGSFVVYGSSIRFYPANEPRWRIDRSARFVAPSRDDRWVVVTPTAVELWRAPRASDGSASHEDTLLRTEDRIRCAGSSFDGGRVAVGTSGDEGLAGNVAVCDLERGTTLTWRAHTGPVRALAFDPSGEYLATTSLDGTAAVWSAESGVLRARTEDHGGDVRAVAVHPDGDRFATGTWGGTLHFWSSETGKPLRAPLSAHARSVEFLAWQPGGDALFSTSYDGEVRGWNRQRRCVSVLRLPGGVATADLSRDGTELLLVGLDRKVYRVPYPPFEAAAARAPDDAFYAPELVALGLAPTEAVVSRSSPSASKRVQKLWLSLRAPEPADDPHANLHAAKTLDAELGGPVFARVLVGLALLNVGDVSGAIAVLEATRGATIPDAVSPTCWAALSLAHRANGDQRAADECRDRARDRAIHCVAEDIESLLNRSLSP